MVAPPALLASLPMYDLPELRAATDDWWRGLARAFHREGLRDVPVRLSRGDAFGAEWRDLQLLFSQCCGMDFVTQGRDHLRLLATPVYAVPDCQGPLYCSLLMVRTDDPAQTLADLYQRRVAVNMPGSHSGYNVLRYMIAPLAERRSFFSQVVVSGSHAASLTKIQNGAADCAAVDCVSFALLQQHRATAVQGLRILCRSPLAPGLPYVCQRRFDGNTLLRLRNGLFAALIAPELAAARTALLLQDAVVLEPEDYQCIKNMKLSAQTANYTEIC